MVFPNAKDFFSFTSFSLQSYKKSHTYVQMWDNIKKN